MEEEAPAYQVDVNSLDTSAEIASLHQEGNFLIGVTNKGVKFRQHIPQGKMLIKEGDQFRIVDMASV